MRPPRDSGGHFRLVLATLFTHFDGAIVAAIQLEIGFLSRQEELPEPCEDAVDELPPLDDEPGLLLDGGPDDDVVAQCAPPPVVPGSPSWHGFEVEQSATNDALMPSQ